MRQALELGPDAGRRRPRADPHRVPDGEPPRRAARDSRSDPRRIVPPTQHAAVHARDGELSDADPLRAPRRAPRGGRVTRSCWSSARSSTSSTARGSARPISFSRRRSRSTRSRPGWLRARRSRAPTASPRPSRTSSCASSAARRSASGAPRVPKRRTPLIALAAVVALLGAAAAGFAVSELTSDDGARHHARRLRQAGRGRGGEGFALRRGGRVRPSRATRSRSRWPRGPRT